MKLPRFGTNKTSTSEDGIEFVQQSDNDASNSPVSNPALSPNSGAGINSNSGTSNSNLSVANMSFIEEDNPLKHVEEFKQIDTIGDYWPAQSLFHGSVIDVEWNNGGGSYAEESQSPLDEDLDVAIGSNQEEALAALVSSEYATTKFGENPSQEQVAERRALEEFLAGFTLNMLDQIEDPDGLYKFRQAIHSESFYSKSAGTIYDFVTEEIGKTKLSPNRIGGSPNPLSKHENKRGKNSGLSALESMKENKSGNTTKSSLDSRSAVGNSVEKRPAKIIGYPAPRYYEAKDPVVIISNTQRSTRFGGDGLFREDGLLECRHTPPVTVTLNDRSISSPIEVSIAELAVHGGIPTECQNIVWESELIANEYVTSHDFREKINEYVTSRISYYGVEFVSPAPISLTPWRQAWIPILLDYEFEYTPDQDNWKLNIADFVQTNPNAIPINSPIIISGRMPLASKTGRIIADQIERFLEEENELDKLGIGVIEETDEVEINALCDAYRTRDMLTATLSGLDEELEKLHLEDPLRSGVMRLTKMSIVDSFGQVKELDVLATNMQSPTVGLSLETASDGSIILMKPRIPQGARLNLRLLSADDDGSEANAGSSKLDLDGAAIPSAKTPVCAFLLPDHIEWAMEVFDSRGTACGQLQVAERNWAFGGIQKGKLSWETAPGSDTPLGSLPETGNEHANSFLNKLIEIGLVDEVERGSAFEPEDSLESSGGEGVLSALMRAIDTTYWNMDPFGKGGSDHPAFYMGRPVAVVRAKLRLEIDESERAMSDALRKHSFDIKLGLLDKVGDGLLGYFVNDDYSKFHTIYPVVDDGAGGIQPDITGSTLAQACPQAEDSGHASLSCQACIDYSQVVAEHQALDHPFLEFDPIVEIRPEEDIFLTMLVNVQSSVHVTSGFLPQKEITLLREHWEDAVARIAPTFKVGPVLVDPSSIRMPIDNAKPNLIWKWANKPSTTEWSELPIANSDDLAGLPDGITKAFEGWIKLDIDESQTGGQ